MTTSNDPDAIRAEIAETRAELSYNVDSLADTANPKHIASRQVDNVKGAATGLKERIMGSDDPNDGGAVGDARAAVQGRVSDAASTVQGTASNVGDAISGAPGLAKEKTQGNPLAAGLIAFGAGLLISSLIPSSQKEQRAVSDLQQKAAPLKEKATEAAKELAGNLQAPAQEAAQAVKDTAVQGVENVKDEGQSAKEQVQGQAAASKDTIQQERQS